MAPGALHAGDVEVIAIGIPRGAPTGGARGPDRGARCWTCTRTATATGRKFASGVVVVAGGGEGLTGAPTMAALAAQRARRGLRAGGGARAGPDDAGAAAAGGHDAAGCPTATAATRRRGSRSVAEMAERAGAVVLGPGLGRADGAVAFAREVAQRVRGAAADRRRRPERPRRCAGVAARAQRRHGADAPRGRAGPPAGARPRARSPPHRLAARPRGGRAPAARWCCSRATTRSWPRPAGPVAVSPGGTPGAGHRGHRRRALGPDRRAAGQGPRPVRGRRAGPPGPRRAPASAAAERHGADHVVAGDVIEALPRASAPSPEAA